MSEPLRLAIFDVDGTLVDSQHNIVAAIGAACAAAGFAPPPAEAIRRIIGLSLVEAIAQLFPEESDETHHAMAVSYKNAFFAQRGRPDFAEPLFPGAIEALAALESDGWLLGIATGKSTRGVQAMIERHGLVGRFSTIQTADGNPGKPHPAMVLRAIAETGVEVANAVMIGDTVYDMAMGRSAGVHAAGVVWGYHPAEELLAAGAEILLDSYLALPSHLSSLLGRPACALEPS
jgi:phosphoglycolate phosphatase